MKNNSILSQLSYMHKLKCLPFDFSQKYIFHWLICSKKSDKVGINQMQFLSFNLFWYIHSANENPYNLFQSIFSRCLIAEYEILHLGNCYDCDLCFLKHLLSACLVRMSDTKFLCVKTRNISSRASCIPSHTILLRCMLPCKLLRYVK